MQICKQSCKFSFNSFSTNILVFPAKRQTNSYLTPDALSPLRSQDPLHEQIALRLGSSAAGVKELL